jgi:hypothetical protein
MQKNMVDVQGERELLEKQLMVDFAEEDRPPLIPPAGNVVIGAWVLYP